MPVTDSPLRYPGGKTQLTSFVVELLRKNELFYGAYAEPFAGGCGVALRLLLNGYVSEIHINDIDPAIYAFWACVLRRTDELCERITDTAVTMEEWHRQREVLRSSRSRQADLGFAALFLNRTNRSGILRGGVIGGLGQTGNYLIDCRFHKANLIKKIRRIGSYADQVSLTRLDAERFLREVVPKLPKKTLINIDPPYYKRGPELYCSFYEHEDHESLAVAIARLDRPWLVTYDDAPEIRAMYEKFKLRKKSLKYSAQEKRMGVELLVVDPRLRVPVARPQHDQ